MFCGPFLFHLLKYLKSFHLCFGQYWSPALQLFIICGSEPRTPKKSVTNAATIDWYWMTAQLTLVFQRGNVWKNQALSFLPPSYQLSSVSS